MGEHYNYNPKSICIHLKSLWNRDIQQHGIFKTWESIQFYINCWKYNIINKDKISVPSCLVCGMSNGKVHACLSCIFFICKNEHNDDHFQKDGHSLSLDLSTNNIYCHICKCYNYDSEISRIAEEQKKRAKLIKLEDNPDNASSWTPGQQEIEIINHNTLSTGVSNYIQGLRGLNNLGNTCFMNVILQSFVHNPLLVRYFLSDMHSTSTCALSKSKKHCLACEMDYLFASMYSGETSPFSPHHFLYTTWKCTNHLAGYEQQDAHDFFISSLNGIHNHCEDSRNLENGITNSSNGTQNKNCSCIIHKIFSGHLRSDLRCNACNFSSTSYDPFFDISLNINFENRNDEEQVLTLEDALYRYTQPELLEKYTCNNCKSTVETTKQLTIKRLPNILSFHIKRFRQTASSTSIKIDTYVQFPLTIDMAPYTSGNLKTSDSMDVENPKKDIYSLYALVNHFGNLENGHYTCYIRNSKNNWFKCEDHVIKKVFAKEVLESKAYILYYVRNILEYNE